MSDDDRDIDVESDDEYDSRQSISRISGNQFYSQRGLVQAEKRAHHNALERKRRDHIKDSFTSLRDSVPDLSGEKVASRAQILKKAAEYIQSMRKKTESHKSDIKNLQSQNSMLEAQIRTLEKAKSDGNMKFVETPVDTPVQYPDSDIGENDSDSDSSSMESPVAPCYRKTKKLKTNSYSD